MKMTFGFELEVGDVRRDRKVPEKFGSWEYAETDIVNLYSPYKNIATDPLGKEPPVGGEINIYPGRSPEEVSARVVDTIAWFRKHGDKPTASCVNHGHVHIRVVGLWDDIKALKQLTAWIMRNQSVLIAHAYGYQEHSMMRHTRTARTYLKWDGGRPMPPWMGENIIKRAESFDDFIRIQCCGKDGLSMGRPFRYAINTYCLKHTNTIEFRFFRASLDHREILDSLRLSRDILVAALNDGPDALELLLLGDYQLPPFKYDHSSYLGWERTKYPKERGKKERYVRDI